MAPTARFDSELGAFLEEICADLCRFECSVTAACAPGDVSIEREVTLAPDVHADMRVEPPRGAPFFVENKLEYAPDDLVARIRQKYGKPSAAWRGAQRLAVVLDRAGVAAPAELERALRAAAGGLAIEMWDVEDLLGRIRSTFGAEITRVSRTSLLDVSTAIERAQWRTAFEGKFPDDPRTATLLWHFSPWELARLHRQRLTPDEILTSRLYDQAVIVMADLCSFSSYVRDTPDHGIIRECLTSFYSKARYQILNNGGMFYQFVGDEVIGLFGVPDGAVA